MSDDKKVVDFTKKRNETIEQKRRQFERVVFQEFLGVYTVVDDQGTSFPVSFVDISKDGCQFQMPFSLKAKNMFKAGTEVKLKLFFTKGSYIPAIVTVRHASEYVDQQGDAWLRLGSEFDTQVPSYQALSHFIEFIYKYAEFSQIDRNESKTYFV